MKKYMAVFLGAADKNAAWDKLDEATKKEREKAGMAAWGKWVTDHKADIVDMGSPLGKTKKIDSSGISDTKNDLAAYTVVQAESYDDAAKMFVNHPHFSVFPGDRVEVMECLPIPGM